MRKSLPLSTPPLHAALLLALTLPWILNPSFGPSPIVIQALIAGGAAVLWFLWRPASRSQAAGLLATAWLAAAVANAAVGLAQHFVLINDSSLWISASYDREVFGNLRQRNQLATLLAIGLASAFYLLAQIEGRLRWALGACIVLMSVVCALTSSRTGMIHWIVLCAAAMLFPLLGGSAAWRGWSLLAAGSYALTMALVPAMIERVAGGVSCVSRKVLWQNALHMAAERPWTGWGLGELDYAHYATLYPGERFCLILDNAHNLFLHAAVELGIPFALLLLAAAMAVLVIGRPWRERDPARLLGWTVLALIMLHSMVEYPLWYGPFQLAVLLAATMVWPGERSPGAASAVRLRRLSCGLAAVGLLYVGWDYHRMAQIYLQPSERSVLYPAGVSVTARPSILFRSQVEFAQFTTTDLTPANAGAMALLGERVLHYSPEPQVVEKLIDALKLLGLADRAAWHEERFLAAFPEEHAKWARQQQEVPLLPTPSP